MVLKIFSWAMIISALMSWIVHPGSKLMQVYWFLKKVTEPIVAPFRRITAKFVRPGLPIDLAPMLAYICIQLLASLLNRVAYYVVYLF